MPLYKVTKTVTKKTVYYTTAWDYWCAENKVAKGEINPFGEEEISIELDSEIPSDEVEEEQV